MGYFIFKSVDVFSYHTVMRFMQDKLLEYIIETTI